MVGFATGACISVFMPCVAELGPVESLGTRFGMYQFVIGLGYVSDSDQRLNEPSNPRDAYSARSRFFLASHPLLWYLCARWLDDHLSGENVESRFQVEGMTFLSFSFCRLCTILAYLAFGIVKVSTV
jgi:hypothetical protein